LHDSVSAAIHPLSSIHAAVCVRWQSRNFYAERTSMSVTGKLLKVFEVDKQLRGLRSRLTSAEKFLAEQDKDLASLSSKKEALEKQIKQMLADAHNSEGEGKRIEARMNTIRSQMDNAQSNKEYKAFLTELNTLKAAKDVHDTAALETMTRVEALKGQTKDLDTKTDERKQVRKVAVSDRDARSAEIAGRVAELDAQRKALSADVPADMLSYYTRMLEQRGDEAMGPIEIVDHKRHEYNCGICMMHLPVDAIAGLIVKGDLTRCASCQCILYIDDETTKDLADKKAEKAEKAERAEKKAAGKPKVNTKGLRKEVAKDVARDLAPKKKIEKPAMAPLAGTKAAET
jgi:predicted  nucleic acid-binding Zn-ribbon protein